MFAGLKTFNLTLTPLRMAGLSSLEPFCHELDVRTACVS